MIFSLFYGHNSFCTVQCILGQQLLFKRKHRSVVPIHGHVHRKLRSLTWGLSDGKKVQDCHFMFLSRRRCSREERNGFVKEAYVVKYQGQVSNCLHVFAGFFSPQTLLRLQFMLGLHFTPACVLLSVCSLHCTLSLHFTPVPQSAVCILHWPILFVYNLVIECSKKNRQNYAYLRK